MQRPLTLCNGGADAWHQSGLFAEVLLPEAVVLKQRFPASAPVQRPQLDGHDRLRHAVCMRLLLSPNLQGIHAIPTQRGVHGCSLSRAMTMPRPLTKMPGLQGISALMCAAGRGDVTSVAILVDAGADLDLTDRMGSTAVHAAACRGRLQVVQHLLSRGASLNKQ